MTEERKPDFLYLDRSAIEAIHATLSAWAVAHGDESIPPFSHARPGDIETLIHAPQRGLVENYPNPTRPANEKLLKNTPTEFPRIF